MCAIAYIASSKLNSRWIGLKFGYHIIQDKEIQALIVKFLETRRQKKHDLNCDCFTCIRSNQQQDSHLSPEQFMAYQQIEPPKRVARNLRKSKKNV